MATLLTVRETAEELNIGESTVWKLISQGRIASVKIYDSRRVPRAAIEAFIASLTEPAGA